MLKKNFTHVEKFHPPKSKKTKCSHESHSKQKKVGGGGTHFFLLPSSLEWKSPKLVCKAPQCIIIMQIFKHLHETVFNRSQQIGFGRVQTGNKFAVYTQWSHQKHWMLHLVHMQCMLTSIQRFKSIIPSLKETHTKTNTTSSLIFLMLLRPWN